ncbi:Shieldin complex subunit 1 [Galemys pyrenaicus]|uniref:Shieldin complex subunit 1 n=1 Tax=Galemys pyrenaicus TaxID=202257 RepID=A0A8J6AF17_GALPY|nr:Shieldin complex subunit 1 [Galemys pyrenaicus]
MSAAEVTMAVQEATPGSQPEESSTLDLPSAYDVRDYVLQRPSQDADSGAFSTLESFSFPCSSDVDPAVTKQCPTSPWSRLEQGGHRSAECVSWQDGVALKQGSGWFWADGSGVLMTPPIYTRVQHRCAHLRMPTLECSQHHRCAHLRMPTLECSQHHRYSSNPNIEHSDSWTSKHFCLDPSLQGQQETKAEDDTLRESLDRFYEMFSHPQPASRNPLSTSVCRCLTQKVDELRGQENLPQYALRSFQMARVIFSRDGCSALQKHSRAAHFYPCKERRVSVDRETPTPGLSKDVIHFLLQQNVMKDEGPMPSDESRQ